MQRLSRSLLVISSAASLALQPLCALAQQAANPVVQPATQGAATQPIIASQPVGTRPATTQISINFKDAPIDAVLEHLSEVAGFVVVKDAGTSIDGRVTVFSKQPVSPEEAVALLNTVLKVNGYTAVQMGRILRITAREKAKKGSIPVHFGADASQIELTDDLLTQVVPIRSVDAVKLKADLQPLVSLEADLSSNAGSNTIMITDTSANIHRVVEIISNLDKRDALENSIRVKQLKYADATAAAKLISDIFKSDDQQQQNQSNVPPQVQFFRAMQRGGGGGGAGGAQDQSDKGRTGRVVASADQRTNTIVVTGPTDTLKVIDSVLEQLDANPQSEQTFFLYPLKNGQALNMQATLNSLFGGNSGNGNNNGNRSNNNNSNYNRNGNSAFGSGGLSGGGGFGSGGLGSGGVGGGGGAFGSSGGNRNSSSGFGSGSSLGSTLNRNTSGNVPGGTNTGAATSELTGQVYVVADQDTNSLLVATATKYESRVREIISELDRPVPQVLIKVLIAEVTHNNSDDFGLDFSVLNTSPRGTGNGEKFGSNLGNATQTGGLVISYLEQHVTATLHALAIAGKLDVLSRPYILASDNQQASITVGQIVPFITESRLDVNSNTINTIQYQDIGIILNVTPHINPDGLVILDVAPQISSMTETTVPISPTVNAPVFQLRSADSRVGIKDGQTIVIGGLMQDQKTSTVHKIPLLGDIPILGQLFRRTQLDKTKTELLIFLTPHVAPQSDNLKPMSRDEMRGVKLTPTAVEPGMFQEHMRGMQRGGPATEPAFPEQSPTDGPSAVPAPTNNQTP